MKISLENLAKAVQEKRKVLGLTQDELGRITEINRLLIGRIESQKFLPSIPQLENLLKKLDIAFEEILEKEESPNVFVAMRGEAKTEDEKIAVDKMISMMLCLKMHHVLRGKLYA